MNATNQNDQIERLNPYAIHDAIERCLLDLGLDKKTAEKGAECILNELGGERMPSRSMAYQKSRDRHSWDLLAKIGAHLAAEKMDCERSTVYRRAARWADYLKHPDKVA